MCVVGVGSNVAPVLALYGISVQFHQTGWGLTACVDLEQFLETSVFLIIFTTFEGISHRASSLSIAQTEKIICTR